MLLTRAAMVMSASLALLAPSSVVAGASSAFDPPALAVATMTESAALADATCDKGCQLFTDTAALTADTTAPFASPIRGHIETSALLFNGQYLMYYRTFIDESGTDCSATGVPQGIALATSSNGQSWAPVDGGKPLPALRSVGGINTCNQDGAPSSAWPYAPDVIVDGSQLLMVFERRDKGAGANAIPTNSIYSATSSNGTSWSAQTQVLAPGAPGAWDHQIGTPDIEKDGTQYLLTFHGNNANGTTLGTSFRRGIVKSTSVGGLSTATRTQFALSSTPAWASYGLGMGDMIKEPDGYWYMIFEAFANGSTGGGGGACLQPPSVNSTAIGIARSDDAINWSVRTDALIYGLDGFSCGFDMPAWSNVGVEGFVTTPEPPTSSNAPVRWKLVTKSSPTQVPSSAHSLGPNQSMPATNFTLQSSPAASRLVMQTDGNLVHYRNADNFVLWASQTNGSSAATKATRVVMQYDGNLVFFNSSGGVVASTGTFGHPDARLFVDPTLVSINTGGYSIWSTPADRGGMS